MDFSKLTVVEATHMLKNKKITSLDLMDELTHIGNKHHNLNFTISNTNSYAKAAMDHNTYVLPIGVKDNFHVKGLLTTCASKMMSKYISPISSTITTRLEQNNMFSFIKTNMDEFAMGSTGMTSYFGSTFSPYRDSFNRHFLPGGSSSGSAAAVSCGAVLAALGSDTGGSIRQPAAWCGIVGFKPTYGALSRYGIVELASSLDCPGFLTKNVADAKYMLQCTEGKDKKDPNTCNLHSTTKPKKAVGIITNLQCTHSKVYIREVCNYLHNEGYKVIEFDLPFNEYLPELYYIINTIEASSNLSRFNRIVYGAHDVTNDTHAKFRTHYFGEEVKRRILVGNFIKSKELFHKYYTKTKEIINEIWQAMYKVLKQVDGVLMSSACPAMTIEQYKTTDPIELYRQDQFTCLANLLGLPAISIPVGFFPNKSPMGIQVIGNPLEDFQLLDFASKIENYFNFQGAI